MNPSWLYAESSSRDKSQINSVYVGRVCKCIISLYSTIIVYNLRLIDLKRKAKSMPILLKTNNYLLYLLSRKVLF